MICIAVYCTALGWETITELSKKSKMLKISTTPIEDSIPISHPDRKFKTVIIVRKFISFERHATNELESLQDAATDAYEYLSELAAGISVDFKPGWPAMAINLGPFR